MDLDYLQALMGEVPAAEEAGYRGVLVVAERAGGSIARSSFEVLGRARELADGLGSRVTAVILGPAPEGSSTDLIARGADAVVLCPADSLAVYRTATYARALCQVIEAKRPEIVLLAATCQGRDLAPRVAARLKTGLVAGALSLEIDDAERLLLATTADYGGALLVTRACPSAKPQIATVRPGALRVPSADKYREGETETVEFVEDPSDLAVEVGAVRPRAGAAPDLGEARIIVAGGRGLGGPDGFESLGRLAGALGGVVGASRGAVEAGWIGKESWVGVMGRHVSPDLYIACGIRGALQHRLGMKGSKGVVVVNTDADAPFFRYADFGIVGDYREVVPAIIQALG